MREARRNAGRGPMGSAGWAGWGRWAMPTGLVLVGILVGAQEGRAQNLLENPSFDEDAASWILGEGADLLWSDSLNANACSGSGSALVPSTGDSEGQVSAILQCVELHGEQRLFASVWHRGEGQFDLRLLFYTASDCLSGPISAPVASEAQDPQVWNLLTMLEDVPAAARSVFLLLAAGDAGPHQLVVDNVMLTEEFPIFLDGFDGNDPGETTPCLWGS